MADIEDSVTNGYDHQGVQHNDEGVNGAGDEGDLFDSDSEAQDAEPSRRMLNDSELDSGDDLGRDNRVAQTLEGEDYERDDAEAHEEVVLKAEIARIRRPEFQDLYLLNMPPFLGLEHKAFDYASYEAPQNSHDGSDLTSHSAFKTAATTVFWRRDPKDQSKLQSNSRIVRWSDGSLTLQIASNPKDHYRISTTALRQSFANTKYTPNHDYDPAKDSHVYLAAPHAAAELYQFVAPVDAAMKVLPTGDLADESVQRLRETLAKGTNIHDPLVTLKQIREDPEMAKKSAELFEKDRLRALRKRDAAEEKMMTRKERVLGGRGLGRTAGLSVAGLEDDDGMPTARGKKASTKRRQNRRGDIYSDDEDEDLPRGRTREDEYDLDDGFMAASDEEPEVFDDDGEAEDDDPDLDDLEIEGRNTVVREKTRGERDREERRATPKKEIGDVGGGEEAEAGTQASPGHARKKRRVVEDDEEDE